MHKPGKSFNTGVKTSYLSSHKDALQKKQPCRRGSAPYRRSDWTSRLWAMSKVGLFKTTRERRALSLLFWRSDSLEHGLNISETPRSCALQRAPVCWTLTLETNHLWSLGPCQCRTTEQRLQRRAFPVTSRSRGLPEGARTDHVTPKQRTELTRENETKKQQPASTTDSKYNKQSVFILTKLVKFDLNAVTEQRHLSWIFSGWVKR